MKTALLAAVALFAAAPCHADGLIDDIGPKRFIAFTAANLADKASTSRAIHHGAVESGPGVSRICGRRPKDGCLVGMFVLDEVVYVGVSKIMPKGTPRDVFQIGMIGSRGIVATLNLRF